MKIYPEGSKRAAVSRMFPIWERLGHEIVNSPNNADVQLSIARIANKRLPTVLRIDGVYYDSGINYEKANKSISDSHKIADAVVYQSNTSMFMCMGYLDNCKPGCNVSVIHNGIDPTGWNAPKKHKNIRVYCSGKWRRPKRLEEIIEVFYMFKNLYPESELHVLGSFKKGGKEIPGNNIIYHEMVNHERMRSLYTKGDVFIHLCKRDSCPSAVIEAMASGMPVVLTDSCGGATEVVGMGRGNEIVEGDSFTFHPEQIYKDYCHQLIDEIKTKIVGKMHNVIKYGVRAEFPEQLHIDNVAKKYLDVMEGVI